ncbi:MAG: MATE family efflux transporter [Clostridia bacterium]|nr:MATE family efflux transporter [Clostridia bacterium]
MKALTSELQHKKMTETPITRLLISLSLPSVANMLLSSIYNMADTYFVTSLGESAIGGVGIVFSIQSIIQSVGFGVSMGSSSIVSRKLGEKDNNAANRFASSAVLMGFVLGLLIAVICLLVLDPLLLLIGATETILPFARDYATVILIAAPLMCTSFVLGPLLRAEGRATFSMLVGLSGGLINMALDPIFIFVFGLGVKGAAIATAISQTISFSIAMAFYVLGKGVIKLSPKFISHSLRDYWLIIKTGAPTVFRQGLGSVATTLLNVRVKIYGDAAVAAVSLANKVYIFIRSIVLGVGQGFQPIAGYNYGAKRLDRVKKVFVAATIFGSCGAVLGALLCATVPHGVMNLFGAKNPEVAKIGARLLFMYAFALPLLGFSSYVNMMYQSLGFVKGATFLASCRQGVYFIPLILILPFFFKMDGVLMTQPLADILTFLTSIPFCVWFIRKILNTKKSPV